MGTYVFLLAAVASVLPVKIAESTDGALEAVLQRNGNFDRNAVFGTSADHRTIRNGFPRHEYGEDSGGEGLVRLSKSGEVPTMRARFVTHLQMVGEMVRMVIVRVRTPQSKEA